MRTALLTRMITSDEGTFGEILTDSGFRCSTGELPYRGNAPELSCIPAGTYICTWKKSEKHGPCYHIEGVEGREGVEIHSANFMGDKTIGFKCELLGCIAPGTAVGVLCDQDAVLNSKVALKQLEDDLGGETFRLTIEDPSSD